MTGNKYFFGSAHYGQDVIDWALANGWKIQVSLPGGDATATLADPTKRAAFIAANVQPILDSGVDCSLEIEQAIFYDGTVNLNSPISLYESTWGAGIEAFDALGAHFIGYSFEGGFDYGIEWLKGKTTKRVFQHWLADLFAMVGPGAYYDYHTIYGPHNVDWRVQQFDEILFDLYNIVDTKSVPAFVELIRRKYPDILIGVMSGWATVAPSSIYDEAQWWWNYDTHGYAVAASSTIADASSAQNTITLTTWPDNFFYFKVSQVMTISDSEHSEQVQILTSTAHEDHTLTATLVDNLTYDYASSRGAKCDIMWGWPHTTDQSKAAYTMYLQWLAGQLGGSIDSIAMQVTCNDEVDEGCSWTAMAAYIDSLNLTVPETYSKLPIAANRQIVFDTFTAEATTILNNGLAGSAYNGAPSRPLYVLPSAIAGAPWMLNGELANDNIAIPKGAVVDNLTAFTIDFVGFWWPHGGGSSGRILSKAAGAGAFEIYFDETRSSLVVQRYTTDGNWDVWETTPQKARMIVDSPYWENSLRVETAGPGTPWIGGLLGIQVSWACGTGPDGTPPLVVINDEPMKRSGSYAYAQMMHTSVGTGDWADDSASDLFLLNAATNNHWLFGGLMFFDLYSGAPAAALNEGQLCTNYRAFEWIIDRAVTPQLRLPAVHLYTVTVPLTADAAEGDTTLYVQDGSRLVEQSDYTLMDSLNSELIGVNVIDGNTLLIEPPLRHAYTVANGAKVIV